MSKKNEKIEKIYEELNDKLIDLMEQHGSDWSKQWTTSLISGWPTNIQSRKQYGGMNIFSLIMAGFESPYWGTFRQWEAIGGKIKSGSKSSQVLYWQMIEKKEEKWTDKERKQYDKTGRKPYFTIQKYHNVFNLQQIDISVKDLEKAKLQTVRPQPESEPTEQVFERVEKFIQNTKAEIVHKLVRCPYYAPKEDQITMIPKRNFNSDNSYWSTLLHEVAHWTGHKSRLDRFGEASINNKEDYAAEELVAEVSSVYLSAILEVDKEIPAHHAEYLNSWLGALKGDKYFMRRAFQKATKVVQYLEALQNVKEDTEEQEQEKAA